MKFVADESVDQPIVDRLRSDGHEVVAVAELDPGISDDEVPAISNDLNSVLITSDTDFGELVFRQRMNSAGVILLRFAGLSADTKAHIVSRVVNEHGQEFSASFSVVGPTTVRIRRGRA